MKRGGNGFIGHWPRLSNLINTLIYYYCGTLITYRPLKNLLVISFICKVHGVGIFIIYIMHRIKQPCLQDSKEEQINNSQLKQKLNHNMLWFKRSRQAMR